MKEIKNNHKRFLISLNEFEQPKEAPQILRIILDDLATQIDFGYSSTWKNEYGTIEISPQTFIKVQGTTRKFLLIKTINIPIAPEGMKSFSRHDWIVFTLFFDPIPVEECVFDIIEESENHRKIFNYRGLKFEFATKMELL